MLAGLTALLGGGGGGGGSFESIASATGTGSSGTITFSSIPSTYKHLQIRGLGRSTYSGERIGWDIKMNGDTGSNYTRHKLIGNGSTVSAGGNANLGQLSVEDTITGDLALTNAMGVSIVDVADYASTSKYKTARIISAMDTNAGSSIDTIVLSSGLWMSTSAITSITLNLNSGSWTTSSKFSLYGIKG